MSFLTKPLGLTSTEFAAHVGKLRWQKGWRPSFVTLHNTAEPSLKQWQHFGLGQKDGAQRIRNLNAYYKSRKWHSGPHLFVAPDFIWIACDLEADGVHCTCFNKTSIGIEMVGDFEHEAFDSGDGLRVRENSVFAVATLYRALNLAPATLRFHRECVKDHHACPGKNVDKDDFVARVTKALSPPPKAPAAKKVA